MKPATPKTQRCAIYTRVSTDQGLEQEFNSLHAQREAASAYVKSQAHEGWKLIRDHYDDGGFSGGSMERPALLWPRSREAGAGLKTSYPTNRSGSNLSPRARACPNDRRARSCLSPS